MTAEEFRKLILKAQEVSNELAVLLRAVGAGGIAEVAPLKESIAGQPVSGKQLQNFILSAQLLLQDDGWLLLLAKNCEAASRRAMKAQLAGIMLRSKDDGMG